MRRDQVCISQKGDVTLKHPLFPIKTADYLAPKISTALRKLARLGGFSICWRVGNTNITHFCFLEPILVFLTIVLLLLPRLV